MTIKRWKSVRKWLTPGLGIKRWLALLLLSITLLSLALAELLIEVYRGGQVPPILSVLTLRFLPPLARVAVDAGVGLLLLVVSARELNRSILAPFTRRGRANWLDLAYDDNRREKGFKLVALGGGTGLPAVLRGARSETSQITAIVTMADDGGSSGKLRREFGILPPGDVRNNIAALADDEAMMTRLFQYRFGGGLEGHSFGNLFLTALADITGSMDKAIAEAGKVLAIQGRVLPSTVQDTRLAAEIRKPDGTLVRVVGESQIPEAGGRIERLSLLPERVRAYPEAVRAILNADMIVIGPGSLFTSILPNLLVDGIPEAIRASAATVRVYICNIATQKGETDQFSVADHILALERHVGRGVFTTVLANNTFPTLNAGSKTVYVQSAPATSDTRKRYTIVETDLTDPERPWRHSPDKLNRALLKLWAERDLIPQPDADAAVIPHP
jgi:uncharacterized cofD-like protein